MIGAIGLISNTTMTTSIQILNNDVLLNIFDLYRLADSDQYADGIATVFSWRQCWWYKLAHVCRQWRNIILESPSRLDLCLFCTNGVPVADMLAHSPPLPLTIHYHNHPGITAEDESGILLALSHRDRVRHILFLRLPTVGKFVTVMDDHFPILELVYIDSWTEAFGRRIDMHVDEVDLPVTFQAPNLRHLVLGRASVPIESPLLITSTAGLVDLELDDIPASAYFPPSYLLTWLSLMAQLKWLSIAFNSPTPNSAIEGQLHQSPDMTTLPNLRKFVFAGVSAYLEGLISRISTPSLSIFRVCLFNQQPFTVPHLLQFMNTSNNLRFTGIHITFEAHGVSLHVTPWKWNAPLELEVRCGPLDSQVASAVQFFRTFSPVLSIVEEVTFSYPAHYQSSEWHSEVDRSQWRDFLRPFTNVKTIHVQDGLVGKFFRSLPSDDGELPPELLPNLEEVGHSGELDALGALNAFVDARRAAGHPVNLRMVEFSIFRG
jgi:hypothetical protein